MRKSYYSVVCFLLTIIALGVHDSYGAGFGIFTQDASSTSQASATIAHTDNSSAVFYNPALINQLPGTQIEAGTSLLMPHREFTSALTGQKTKVENQTFFPSTFYVTYALNEKFSVGFGIFNPFGLGTKWPDNWEGRYLATNSKLTTFAFNPVASVKLAPWLTVAGGVTYLTIDTTLERKLNFSLFGLSDGSQKFHGTGDGFGFNAGLLVEPVRDTSVGISYRSKIHTDIQGNVSFGIPAAGVPFLGSSFPNTDARTKLDLPAQAYAGVCFKQLYPLTIEVATRWEQWSSFKQLELQFAQPVAGSYSLVQDRNWRDTWTGMIGLKYQISNPVALLAGYLYQRGAVPDSTFEPAIPDANSHYFSFGTSIKLKSVTIDAGYAYQLLLKHAKNNTVDDNPSDGIFNPATAANGTYKSHLNVLALNLTYRF